MSSGRLAKAALPELMPLEEFALQFQLVGEFRPLFHLVEVAEKLLGRFEQVPLFNIGVGGERAEAATGEDHVAGFHVIPGVAQFIHHAGGEGRTLGVRVDGDDRVDLAHVPVQVAVDGVGVDGFAVTVGHAFKTLADLDRLWVHDDGVFAELVDDPVDLLALFRRAVTHRIAGVDDPGVGVGDELVEGLGRFAHGDDVMGNAHIAGPILREADLLVHPGEDLVKIMVSFLKGLEEGIGDLGVFQLLFDGPFGVDEGDDQVGFDEITDDPLVLKFPINPVPLDGGGGTDDDVPLVVAEDFVSDFFVFPFPGQLKDVIGCAEQAFERLFPGLGEVVDGVVDLDLAVVAVSEGDNFADILRIVHASDHSGDESSHGERMSKNR